LRSGVGDCIGIVLCCIVRWLCIGNILAAGVGVGVGVGDCDLARLYFVWPDETEATKAATTVARMIRMIIRQGKSKRFAVSTPNCKAKTRVGTVNFL